MADFIPGQEVVVRDRRGELQRFIAKTQMWRILPMDGKCRKAFKAKQCEIRLVQERTILPPALREERILRYCTKKYPFRELYKDLFSEPLETIHERAVVTNRRMSRNPILKRMKEDIHRSQRFQELYERFVKDFVGTLLCTREHPMLLYAKSPTSRCHLSSMTEPKSNGRRHTDFEYNHVPQEINFWLPITKVFGSSTLWVESHPGWGDFHPLNLEYGEVAMFWGNQCEHYTVPNDSGNTRLSFDFRVLCKRFYDPRKAMKPFFVLGQYYKEVKIDFD